MVIETSAPSNIALVKYMGKADSASNYPVNSSLSYTLEELRTFVRFTLLETSKNLKKGSDGFSLNGVGGDEWAPLEGQNLQAPLLSEEKKKRYLSHFQWLKGQFQIPYCFLVESANNFPSDAGLASSASSFAALTLGAYHIYKKIHPSGEDLECTQLGALSRRGSGSSCRSFFPGWVVWTREGTIGSLDLGLGNLLHQVVIVSSQKKDVSSSQAHSRVTSSLNFKGRAERAEGRLGALTGALRGGDWRRAFEVTWSEFWDMHGLFETSDPSFGYLTAGSLEVLDRVRRLWKERGDGPLVTMDAGANVHLLYRENQEDLARWVLSSMGGEFSILSSTGHSGGGGSEAYNAADGP